MDPLTLLTLLAIGLLLASPLALWASAAVSFWCPPWWLLRPRATCRPRTSLAMMLPPVGILAVMQYHKAGEVHWAYALVLCVTLWPAHGAAPNEPQASGSLGEARVWPGHAVRLHAHAVSRVDPTQTHPLPMSLLTRIQALAEEHLIGMGGHSDATCTPTRSCLLKNTKRWLSCPPPSPRGGWTTKPM